MRRTKKSLLSALAAGAAIAAAVCALNVSRGYGWSRSVCDGLFVASVDIKLTQTNQWPFSTQRRNRMRKKLGRQHPSL